MIKKSRTIKKIRQNNGLLNSGCGYKKTLGNTRDKKKYGFRIASNLYSCLQINLGGVYK